MTAFKNRYRCGMLLVLLLAVCALTTGACAQEGKLLQGEAYCFASEDFSTEELTGIVLTGVPEQNVGSVCLGSRVLRAGDVLPAAELNRMTLEAGNGAGEALVCYLPVTGTGVGCGASIAMQIASGKDEAPTANDVAMETYRDIAITGTFDAQDPEGEALTFAITAQPRRGTVELMDDGTFVYTPENNKVGKDTFGYTATDPAGNVSPEARVTVQINRPTDKTTYADMAGDPDAFVAQWLRERDVFSGEQISSVTVFGPETQVTRGEFLVMTMDTFGLTPQTDRLSTGFADEQATPAWMRPYLAQALRSGMISGVASEEGLVFRCDAQLTQAEAAVILNHVLGLEGDGTAAVFAEEGETAIPAWAAEDLTALSSQGLMDLADPTGCVTRRDAAKLLYQAASYANEDAYSGSLLAWAAK